MKWGEKIKYAKQITEKTTSFDAVTTTTSASNINKRREKKHKKNVHPGKSPIILVIIGPFGVHATFTLQFSD